MQTILVCTSTAKYTFFAYLKQCLHRYLLRSNFLPQDQQKQNLTEKLMANSFYFFSPVEEMSCLATWKEGSSRYLVSMLNHSHVYTDEARYRCFVFQRQHSKNPNDPVTYKMAQSLFASCLGLWNVNEGYKTFTMTKCKYRYMLL